MTEIYVIVFLPWHDKSTVLFHKTGLISNRNKCGSIDEGKSIIKLALHNEMTSGVDVSHFPVISYYNRQAFGKRIRIG